MEYLVGDTKNISSFTAAISHACYLGPKNKNEIKTFDQKAISV